MSKLENLIAYKGAVTLVKAQWDNISGMTVVFQLEQRPHELTAANPFKKFTKMRKGRVGTRFNGVLVETPDVDNVVYNDELMLKGWNDGTDGWKVTFWISSDHGEHPFMGYDKEAAFGFCAVELDDDNTVIDQVKREKVETPRKQKQGLSNYAALLCRTPEFHDWLRSEHKIEFGVADRNSGSPELATKRWMCEKLNIESRAELDSKPELADRFHKLIRMPYAEWSHENP